MVIIRDEFHNICLQCMEHYLREEVYFGINRLEVWECSISAALTASYNSPTTSFALLSTWLLITNTGSF